MRFFFSFLCLLVCSKVFCQTTEFEKTIESIQLVSIQGNTLQGYDLKGQSKGKIVVLEFWETWCMPCIEAMAHVNRLKQAYPNDLLVVCVASEGLPKVINFITKNQYPFNFVFDSTKQLKAIFPHQSIPHTVIVDKGGKIQSQTLPNFLTEKEIDLLLGGKSIDIPQKKIASRYQNNEDASKLFRFELSNSELGDRPEVSITNDQRPKRILKDYFVNTFIDTVEKIKEYECRAQNVLQFYQLAYGEISKYHFLIPAALAYIDSTNLANRYNLLFSSSNLFGNFDDLFINQLNAVFGLQTEKIQIDTTVFILKDIKTSGDILMKKDDGKPEQFKINLRDSLFIKGYISAKKIAREIENIIKHRVELNPSLADNYYEVNIAMERKENDVNEWVSVLKKEGIYIEKEKKKITYISIKKK
ncbi:TlpA family protein disulfide reductase [Niastella caeni]|uniref:TlpA family protein disulfide reductase n=1 Tax=Niastella caeni TaxID=2569763 RepID=A0A4S8HXT9_9BACT|nr:TlpA disulfide reductase family protein [Niastella caeni]THU40553.1 TlpA family protein disulfide reductase [Niastella caeni]